MTPTYAALRYSALGALALCLLAWLAAPARAATVTNQTESWCRISIGTDQTIVSSASSNLVWTDDGELRLEPTNQLADQIWSSGTAGQGRILCWETTGAFSIYSATGAKLWSQGGGTITLPSLPFPMNVKYRVAPKLDGCTLSGQTTITMSPAGWPFPTAATSRSTLWNKPATCPTPSASATIDGWCLDTAVERAVIQTHWAELIWKPDGSLALRATGSAAGKAIWDSATSGNGTKLCFESNGRLAIYNASEQVIWNTQGGATTTSYLLGLDDCDLSIKPLDNGATRWTSPHRCPQSELPINREFLVGPTDQTIVENDRAQLVFTRTGNLILRTTAGDELFTSNLAAGRGKRLAFQTDGNLVVYTSTNSPAWGAKIAGRNIDVMQLDGCALSLRAAGATVWTRGSADCRRDQLTNGPAWEMVATGNATLMRTAEASFVWQGDGNLVLYTAGGTPIWASRTQGRGKRLAFQADGNLVVYDGSSVPVWASNTYVSGTAPRTLKLGDRCKLTIENGGSALWTGIDSCAVVNYTFERPDGDSMFGSALRTHVTAEDTGTARLDSTTSLDATMFGARVELFSASAYQTESDSGSDLENGSITIFGEGMASVNATYSQTFWEQEKTFMVGLVPVAVTAGATGEIGLELAYSGGTLAVTPSAGLYVTVEAGVGVGSDVAGASAGIRGSLTLIELALPLTMNISFQNGRPHYALNGDLELASLSGSLSLYAKGYIDVFGWEISKEWSRKLFGWSGIEKTWNLFSKSGDF